MRRICGVNGRQQPYRHFHGTKDIECYREAVLAELYWISKITSASINEHVLAATADLVALGKWFHSAELQRSVGVLRRQMLSRLHSAYSLHESQSVRVMTSLWRNTAQTNQPISFGVGTNKTVQWHKAFVICWCIVHTFSNPEIGHLTAMKLSFFHHRNLLFPLSHRRIVLTIFSAYSIIGLYTLNHKNVTFYFWL